MNDTYKIESYFECVHNVRVVGNGEYERQNISVVVRRHKTNVRLPNKFQGCLQCRRRDMTLP